MIWTVAPIERIKHLVPKPCGAVKIDHRLFWQALPTEFGQWNNIYRRFRRWIDLGVFDKIENELQSQAIDLKGIRELALDST